MPYIVGNRRPLSGGRAAPWSGYDPIMGLVVGVLVVAAVAGLVVVGFRRVSAGGGSADVDLGSVTEGWLSDHRARKDS